MDSAALLKSVLADAGIGTDPRAEDRLIGFFRLLQKWSARINLTSSLEWQSVGPLFEEAIWASLSYNVKNKTHLDLGTGAGFPAIPLKILHPQIEIDLVESRLKRAVFLESVVRELGLSSVRVHNRRAEEYLAATERNREGWDCVSWKGIKLNHEVLLRLLARTDESTTFWMFHGDELAVESAAVVERTLRLIERKSFPGKRSWFLSIYQKRRLCFT